MITDRELLELAAKAGGMVPFDDDPEIFWVHDASNPGGAVSWNPLTEDGDALRLAVKLEITIEYRGDMCPDGVFCMTIHPHTYEVICASEHYGERSADDITRRAITRAAAEIGRAMP